VFAHIARGEHLTRYAAPLWMIADPAERRGSTQVVAFRGYFAGLPVESVQRVAPRPPSSLEFSQVRGTLRALGGRLTLRATEDGTDVLFRLEVDAAIPMISDDAAQQFLVQFLERMLDRIKLAAERRAPARPRSSAPASEAVLPEAAEEAEGTEEPAPEEPAPDLRAPEIPGSARSQVEPVNEGAPPPAPAGSSPTLPGADRTAQQAQAAAPGSPTGGRHRRRRRRRRRSGGSGGAPSGPRSS